MEDILYPIGTVVKVDDSEDDELEEAKEFMIVGHRTLNPETFNSWDYISVPVSEGFKWMKESCLSAEQKQSKPKFHGNFFYFNHYEILDKG